MNKDYKRSDAAAGLLVAAIRLLEASDYDIGEVGPINVGADRITIRFVGYPKDTVIRTRLVSATCLNNPCSACGYELKEHQGGQCPDCQP